MHTTSPLRIVSLLPAATEIVAALGMRDCLVGRSHECDEPSDVATLPALTAPRIDASASSREIHEQVGRTISAPAVVGDAGSCATGSANGLFALDMEALARLAPDIVLTQASCDVCAIAAGDVAAAANRMANVPRVVSLSAESLAGLRADILAVGAATGRLGRARELVARLQARSHSVACRVRTLMRGNGDRPPRVAVIEWLDPPMAAGNWVPELVRIAGGDDVLGRAGGHSHWITWNDVAAVDPDVVVLVPCGFTLDRVVAEAASADVQPHLQGLRAARDGRVWAIDGHHLFNRPGPRLIDSLEVLAAILHPGAFAFPAVSRFARRLA
jgi:iron complex transport system substrate-binding protein